MLYVFHGPDQFRAREELAALRRGLDRDGNLGHNTQRLEGRGLTPAELRAACQTASLFAEDRLVIIDELQARFGGAGRRAARGSRASARAGARPAAGGDYDELVEVLTSLPPSTTVVLLDEQASDAFLTALGAAATARQFAVLRGPELRAWAGAHAATQGADIAPAALDRLVALIDGHHLGELAQEIDKLATYAAGRRIELEDVDALVSAARELQTWDLTDAVIEGRGERAVAVLRAMDSRDHPPQLLIFLLTRQYRQLLLAQALLRDGLSAEQIGGRLRLSQYPLRKAIEQASRYPAERLEAAYRRLLATDVTVKTGVLDVEPALEMLVVELAALGRGRRAASTPR